MSYASEVLADSPLAYWRLGDASGTTATDSSGNSRPGTYVSSPTLGAGSPVGSDLTNTAMTVGANSGQCCSTASASWMNVSALTVECLANITSAVDGSNGDALVSRYDGSGFNWLLWRNTSGLLAFQIRNNSGTAYDITGPSVTLGLTYHVAATFDGSNVALYVAGASVASTAVTGTVQTGSAPIDIGRYSGSSVTIPGATFDEVAIYGTALSAGRLSAHYAATLVPANPSFQKLPTSPVARLRAATR